jgi:nicotinamidase-related amidase
MSGSYRAGHILCIVISSHPKPAALIVIDVQQGFRSPRWGVRNNPDCEANIAQLLTSWRERGWPAVFARHDSRELDSPLRSGTRGNELEPFLGGPPDLLVVKHVNSAFHGHPDLHRWLDEQDLHSVAICGITTNHCCETTARVAGNLGYDTTFVLDATFTFDRQDLNGTMIPADELARVTAANLNQEFATVQTTATLLGSLYGQVAAS